MGSVALIPVKHFADSLKLMGKAVALAALSALVRDGSIDASVYEKAEKEFGISTEREDITEI